MVLDRKRINSLMQQAASGNGRTRGEPSSCELAFGELVAGTQDELFRLCLANGLSQDEAVEATQETFLRAYRGRVSWKVDADAMSWLCGIAANVVRERHRERRRQTQFVTWLDESVEAVDDLAVASARDLDKWGPEELRQLHEAVTRLPDRQREAIACRFLRGLSIRDTAATMGCAEGTVKSAVSAALESLREILVRRQ